MTQLLLPSKEPKDPTKKESSRQKRMNAFSKGSVSLILPKQRQSIQLLKPSMSSIAIRKCGLEKIEDGLDEA